MSVRHVFFVVFYPYFLTFVLLQFLLPFTQKYCNISIYIANKKYINWFLFLFSHEFKSAAASSTIFTAIDFLFVCCVRVFLFLCMSVCLSFCVLFFIYKLVVGASACAIIQYFVWCSVFNFYVEYSSEIHTLTEFKRGDWKEALFLYWFQLWCTCHHFFTSWCCGCWKLDQS